MIGLGVRIVFGVSRSGHPSGDVFGVGNFVWQLLDVDASHGAPRVVAVSDHTHKALETALGSLSADGLHQFALQLCPAASILETQFKSPRSQRPSPHLITQAIERRVSGACHGSSQPQR
ncbi:hypothetical protein CMZ82_00380 [Lysobacteraceae bacterium NML93-0792]|nr:hypothetical protein CMZ82_00380 [Xanthomonadaceae bacterium NML93-0792]PBS16540.1 hypothetical protein CMZ81_04630 [Xanthomonadaceae bacterium NML93-0793]PBS19915.1 hypothetical protein CMZ80_02685 [Xanthomonadaceae bacterium NML93-0831]